MNGLRRVKSAKLSPVQVTKRSEASQSCFFSFFLVAFFCVRCVVGGIPDLTRVRRGLFFFLFFSCFVQDSQRIDYFVRRLATCLLESFRLFVSMRETDALAVEVVVGGLS